MMKYLKYSYVFIQFSEEFKITQISNGIVETMFSNIENRLLDIYGGYG